MYDYDEDGEEYQETPHPPDYPEPYRQPSSRHFYGETLGTVLQALTEYARTLEHEKSNRSDHERKRTTVLSVIRSQRQVMLEYLTNRFGEREKLYEQYFRLVDTALELRNDEIIRLALESMLTIYQDNPFAGLDQFHQQFEAISEMVRI
jgi:ribosomal protein S15P/S13E